MCFGSCCHYGVWTGRGAPAKRHGAGPTRRCYVGERSIELGAQLRVCIPTIEGLGNAFGSQPSPCFELTFGPFAGIVQLRLGRTAAACNESSEGVTAARLTDRVVAQIEAPTNIGTEIGQ